MPPPHVGAAIIDPTEHNALALDTLPLVVHPLSAVGAEYLPVERRERFLASISPDNKWLTMMRGVAGMTGLTQELVDAIIEKVLVYGEGRITLASRSPPRMASRSFS